MCDIVFLVYSANYFDVNTHTHTYICMHIHARTHTYIHIYAHIYIYMYMCIYMHTHIHVIINFYKWNFSIVWGCIEAQLTKFLTCSSPPKESRVLRTQLSVSANTSYIFQNSTISANISNYNKTYEPFSYLFCYYKNGYDWPFYINCTDSNDSFVQVEYNWQTEGEVDVYVFTEDSNDGYGCDNISTTIGS